MIKWIKKIRAEQQRKVEVEKRKQEIRSRILELKEDISTYGRFGSFMLSKGQFDAASKGLDLQDKPRQEINELKKELESL